MEHTINRTRLRRLLTALEIPDRETPRNHVTIDRQGNVLRLGRCWGDTYRGPSPSVVVEIHLADMVWGGVRATVDPLAMIKACKAMKGRDLTFDVSPDRVLASDDQTEVFIQGQEHPSYGTMEALTRRHEIPKANRATTILSMASRDPMVQVRQLVGPKDSVILDTHDDMVLGIRDGEGLAQAVPLLAVSASGPRLAIPRSLMIALDRLWAVLAPRKPRTCIHQELAPTPDPEHHGAPPRRVQMEWLIQGNLERFMGPGVSSTRVTVTWDRGGEETDRDLTKLALLPGTRLRIPLSPPALLTKILDRTQAIDAEHLSLDRTPAGELELSVWDKRDPFVIAETFPVPGPPSRVCVCPRRLVKLLQRMPEHDRHTVLELAVQDNGVNIVRARDGEGLTILAGQETINPPCPTTQ